jgi:hypothetical protein
MIDDPELLNRQAAYIDTIRGLYRRERNAGFVACLVGVMVIVWARTQPSAPHLALYAGFAIVGAGWLCFAYSLYKRTTWVRTHPFDPNAAGPNG